MGLSIENPKDSIKKKKKRKKENCRTSKFSKGAEHKFNMLIYG